MSTPRPNPLKGTVPSPYTSDNTASNQCGFTLMNNQVGDIVADVMTTKDGVSVSRPQSSLIRVDGTGKIEIPFDEIDEAAGEEQGWFDQHEFEENMSTHYGRMVFFDDRAVLFASPEEAAEYLDFDLVATET